MVSSISSTASAQPAAPVSSTSTTSKKPSASKQSPEVDIVHLSNAAQTQLSASRAALQEATETSAQTAKEAMSGDRQAQRLLTRDAQAGGYSPSSVRGR